MSVPETMRAAVIDRFGDENELHVSELAVPSPEPGEILIRVETAGVASWDALERAGQMAELMGHAPRFPYILGSDGGGEVVGLGDGVDRFAVGDPVYAIAFLSPRGGFYREYAVARADLAAKVPGALDPEQAGAMGSEAVTALQGVESLKVASGDAIAITGASGNVGRLAVQLAKILGLRVLAVASGADGTAQARELGADEAVDGRSVDVAAAARAFAPEGLAAALLFVGGPVGGAIAAAVRMRGTVLAPHGMEPAPEGIARFNAEPGAAVLDRLNALVERGPFTVPIGERFALDQAGAAHAALKGHAIGKIVIKPGVR